MRKSIGEKAALKVFRSRWWKGKSWAEILLKQAPVREVICPFPLYLVAWSNVMGRWPTNAELHSKVSVASAIRVAQRVHTQNSERLPA